VPRVVVIGAGAAGTMAAIFGLREASARISTCSAARAGSSSSLARCSACFSSAGRGSASSRAAVTNWLKLATSRSTSASMIASLLSNQL